MMSMTCNCDICVILSSYRNHMMHFFYEVLKAYKLVAKYITPTIMLQGVFREVTQLNVTIYADVVENTLQVLFLF